MKMKIGDLVIWKGGWGYLDHVYGGIHDTNRACSITWGKHKMCVTAWIEDVREAKEIEVKTGVFITQKELDAIALVDDEDVRIQMLDGYAKKYKVNAFRIVGFGLMESGEIIYTQVVEK